MKDKLVDKKNVLLVDAIVRFKNTFYDGAQAYPVSRFGVHVPAGVTLPKTAEVLRPVAEEPSEAQMKIEL